MVEKLGIEEFRRLVLEERKIIPSDPRWRAFLSELHAGEEKPIKKGEPLKTFPKDKELVGFEAWHRTNVYQQKQSGYGVATITLPLGDATAYQFRELAEIARKFNGGYVRTTVEQNILLRWISEADLPELYKALKRIQLNLPNAGTIVDVTACPGTDTCKLGISSSRGLAGELRTRLSEKILEWDESIQNLRIKVSGCFNSCGQHHLADIGFYGSSRNIGSYKVPHFQVLLGGQWSENAAAYGISMGVVPSKRIPEVVLTLLDAYKKGKQKGERFQDFVKRSGKLEMKKLIDPYTTVPSHDADPSFYIDWGDTREFSIGDLGAGECAGEVVSLVTTELAASERDVFEAQLHLEKKDFKRANELAYHAMLQAAKALVKTQFLDVGNEPAKIVSEFRTRFYETELFFDPFSGGRFAQLLFIRHENPPTLFTEDGARKLIEEAQLFVEAAYSCEAHIAETKASNNPLFAKR